MEFAIFGSVLVLIASIGTTSSQRLVCPVNSQTFVSANRNLLPLENVNSTSESRFNPTPYFVNRGDEQPAWCTAPNLTVAGQYVELNFTEPVVVGLLMSGGFVSTYVSNFTVHYTMSSTEDDYVVYGALRPTQDFLVPDLLSSNANFVLGEQILARRVKFVINDGMLNQQRSVCWKMLLYGCTMTEAQEFMELGPRQTEPPTTTGPSTDDLPTTRLTTAAGSASVPMDCSGANKQTDDNSLLLIVLPAILALTLIVIVIVAILLFICFLRAHNQKKLEYDPSREEMRSGKRTKEAIENGTATPSSVNFHYDNPRFLCYDVPRSSIRSRQNSESMSTLGSVAEIRNPVYAAKRSLHDYRSPSPTYHIPPEDDKNDYEDIPGASTPSELDKRTLSNTSANSPIKPAPPILSEPPKLPGVGVVLDGPQSPTSPTNVHNIHYSQVHKLRSREKDEMEQDATSSPSPPPVINGHYDSANNALVQEIDRLVNDLEKSRAIAKQW